MLAEERSDGQGISQASYQGMLITCCAAVAALVPVALYQFHLVKHLPDPDSSLFDSDKITSSQAAHPLGIPDSLLGITNFGVTLGLILLAKRKPKARPVLGAKLAIDAAAGAFNATRQIVGFRKLCSWCTGTALAAGITAYVGRECISEALTQRRP